MGSRSRKVFDSKLSQELESFYFADAGRGPERGVSFFLSRLRKP